MELLLSFLLFNHTIANAFVGYRLRNFRFLVIINYYVIQRVFKRNLEDKISLLNHLDDEVSNLSK